MFVPATLVGFVLQIGLVSSALRELPSVEERDDRPKVFLVGKDQKQHCPRAGTVCFSSGDGATALGVELTESGATVPVLARGAQIAAKGKFAGAAPDQAWQVEMVARFRSLSEKAPVVIAIFDRADPQSIEAKEAKVVWTIDMNPGRDMGMRFRLSPEDGFEPSHTYLLRVVQTKGSSDRILAESDFHLE